MKVISGFIKGLGYIGLFLFTVFQSYAIGLVFSGAGVALIEAVWSIFKPLPSFLTQKAWLVYLLAGIPVSIAVFTYITIDVAKTQLEKHNKQDN